VKPKLNTLNNCPVCGKQNFLPYLKTKDYFLTGEEFSLVQCKDCGFVFTNPIPKLSELSKYYDSPDYLSHTANSFSFTAEIYKLFRNANIRKKFKLVQSYAKGKNILDIGCGTGELLHYFNEQGWDTLGVEPNSSARDFANKTYQLQVLEESEINTITESSFDVISMWHVLEHVPDLNSRMKQLKQILKKDGLLIIALPNLDSPDAKKYGAHWAGLDVPRHLYHFTESSFKTLLGKHNMQLVEAVPMKFDAFYVSLLSEKYRKHKLPYLPAMISGLQSNLQARKQNSFSSMIFVVRPNK